MNTRYIYQWHNS